MWSTLTRRYRGIEKNLVVIVSLVAVALAGTGCPCLTGARAPSLTGPEPSAAPPMKAVESDEARPCKMRKTEEGKIYVRTGIPDGTGRDGTLVVQRVAPEIIPVGEIFEYKILINNRTNCQIDHVTLTEHPAERFTLRMTRPEAEVLSDGALRWEISPLAKKESHTFTIKSFATEP